MNRSLLRQQAKKIYKENTKKIPKRKRILFADFFKQYKKMKDSDETPELEIPEPASEDFDFENLVNISAINDDDLEPTDNEEDQEQE